MKKENRREWRVYETSKPYYTVYSDDMNLTASGDVVFKNVSLGEIVNGQQHYNVEIALVLKSSSWERIEQYVEGAALYSQSYEPCTTGSIGTCSTEKAA